MQTKPMQQLVRNSLKRRRREINRIFLICALAGFFLSGILLYQDCMNNHLREKNKDVYGDWVFMANMDTTLLDKYPYIESQSHATVAGQVVIKRGDDQRIYQVGTLDDTLIEKGHIKLYEGSFPTNADEVAMDLDMLLTMGYSYELGQTITLPVSESKENGKTITKDYTLVGTLKNYTSFWVQGGALPAALLSESGSEALGIQEARYTFYHLKPAYEKDDFSDVPGALNTGEELHIFYNSYLYDDCVWGTTNMYLTVILVFAVASMAALLYILISYLNSRRSEYERFRSIGATKGQVRCLILTECSYPALLGSFAGILFAYVLLAIVMFVISHAQHIGNGYEIRPVTLLLSVLLSTATITMSILLAQLSGLRRNVTASRVLQLTPRRKKSLARVRFSGKHCAATLQRRQNQLHKKGILAARLLNLAICVVLMLSFSQILDAVSIYQWSQARSDYNYVYDQKETTWLKWTNADGVEEGAGSGNVLSSFYDGPVDSDEQLLPLLGVERVEHGAIDSTHFFNWTGKSNDGMKLFAESQGQPDIVKSLPLDSLLYGYTIYVYEDTRGIYNFLKEACPDLHLSYQAFVEGTQVVLGYDCGLEEMQPSCANGFADRSFMDTDIVQVETAGNPVTAQVAGCIDMSITLDSEKFWGGLPYYNMIASPAFAQKIAQNDGQEFRYNQLSIYLNSAASYEGTQKWLANYGQETGASFSYSNSEQKQFVIHDFYQKLLMHGSIMMITLLLFFVIKLNMIQVQLRYQEQTYMRLKKLGMSDRFYYHMQRLTVLTECLWCLPACIIGVKYPWTLLIYPVMVALIYFLTMQQYHQMCRTTYTKC